MLRKLTMVLAVVALAFAAVAVRAGEHPEKEKEAIAAAEEWLGLVDEEKYPESWKEAAEYFRNAVRREDWEHSMNAVRKPLGKLVSRKVKSSEYKTSLPGAPDGIYVVIQFDTSFESKKTAVETVAPMMDEEGRWRVSGYFVR